MKDYKKILKNVVNIINTTEKSDIGFANICTYIGENCPELHESEDERIRKALLEMVHDTTGDELWVDYNVHKEDALAWLEKQGKQPSAIRWYDVSLIPQEMEELLVEWDSEDATWHEIAFYHADTKTFWNGTRQVKNVTRWCYIIDLLEKQGEQKPFGQREECFDCQFNYAGECKGSCTMKMDEQKPFDYENANIQQKDFAPNDEEMRELLRTEYEKGRADAIAEMQKDWSEEDDYNLQCCIAKVQFDIDNGRIGRNRQLLTWLKSLKERVQPQSNWKPSEEQIKALNAINVTGGISYAGQGQVLIALYNDLLKLKE